MKLFIFILLLECALALPQGPAQFYTNLQLRTCKGLVKRPSDGAILAGCTSPPKVLSIHAVYTNGTFSQQVSWGSNLDLNSMVLSGNGGLYVVGSETTHLYYARLHDNLTIHFQGVYNIPSIGQKVAAGNDGAYLAGHTLNVTPDRALCLRLSQNQSILWNTTFSGQYTINGFLDLLLDTVRQNIVLVGYSTIGNQGNGLVVNLDPNGTTLHFWSTYSQSVFAGASTCPMYTILSVYNFYYVGGRVIGNLEGFSNPDTDSDIFVVRFHQVNLTMDATWLYQLELPNGQLMYTSQYDDLQQQLLIGGISGPTDSMATLRMAYYHYMFKNGTITQQGYYPVMQQGSIHEMMFDQQTRLLWMVGDMNITQSQGSFGIDDTTFVENAVGQTTVFTTTKSTSSVTGSVTTSSKSSSKTSSSVTQSSSTVSSTSSSISLQTTTVTSSLFTTSSSTSLSSTTQGSSSNFITSSSSSLSSTTQGLSQSSSSSTQSNFVVTTLSSGTDVAAFTTTQSQLTVISHQSSGLAHTGTTQTLQSASGSTHALHAGIVTTTAQPDVGLVFTLYLQNSLPISATLSVQDRNGPSDTLQQSQSVVTFVTSIAFLLGSILNVAVAVHYYCVSRKSRTLSQRWSTRSPNRQSSIYNESVLNQTIPFNQLHVTQVLDPVTLDLAKKSRSQLP